MAAQQTETITARQEAKPADLPSALEAILVGRHSCRAFRSQPVPKPTIERILHQAQRTASWCNSQAWQVAITHGAATDRFRDALYHHVTSGAKPFSDFAPPEQYRDLWLKRRRECGFQLYEAVGVARGDREASFRQTLENFRLFGAPHVAIVSTTSTLGPYALVDCGSYVANFMNAAQAVGVATIAQAALARYSDFIRRYFEMDEDRRVVCAISFGYEDGSHPANNFRTARAPLTEVVQWLEE